MPEPFDQIANQYDQLFVDTQVGGLQRAGIYRCLDELLESSTVQNVLEINCGTGNDALWLAQRNCKVLATDRSRAMIEIATKKSESLNAISPEFRCIDLLEVPNKIKCYDFDLLFSNFGGLNCVSPDQLSNWARDIPKFLKPRGYVMAVIMGKFCIWESVYFLSKLNAKKAFRRFSTGPVEANLNDHTFIKVWYYTPRQFTRFFKDDFELIDLRPIGLWVPPSYLNNFVSKRPSLLNNLNRLEKSSSRFGLGAYLSDHYVIQLRKK